MLVIRGKARRHRVRPADPLQPRRDLGVVQAGIVAAVTADELERAAITACHPALHEQFRLAPQNRRTAVAGPASKRKCHGILGVKAQPRVTWIVRTALCRDGT